MWLPALFALLVQPAMAIIDGYTVQPGQPPHEIARVFVANRTLLDIGEPLRCGGVMITRTHILTAAHCFDQFLTDPTASVYIFIDELICFSPDKFPFDSVPLSKIRFHPDYIPGMGENDIAIIPLNQKYYRGATLKLPSENVNYAGFKGIFYGCGLIAMGPKPEQQKRPERMQWTFLTVEAPNDNDFPGFMLTHGRGRPCVGDSGYPMIINGFIVGINSGSTDKQTCVKGAIFTRVSAYSSWILQTIEKDATANKTIEL